VITQAWSDSGSPDKPYEDWYGIADRQESAPIVVLDGGTVRTDTGCRHGVSWYAEQLGSELLRRLREDDPHSLISVLELGIRTVAELHRDTCDLSHPGTPSAAVAMVRPVKPEAWEYAVLGDVTVVFDTRSGPVVVADHRISQSAKHERLEADRWPIGSPEKTAAMLAMKHAELAERNRGYWIAAADPTAAAHALTGQVDDVVRLAVLTDGVARAQAWGILTWSELLDEMDRWGPARVIQRVRIAEASDPKGIRWPRNKASDDATAVLVSPIAY